jgi:hypothetical protein
MAKHARTPNARRAAASARPAGRTHAAAFALAGTLAVAVAGAAAWMTMSSPSSKTTASTPVAQAQPQVPAATTPAPTPVASPKPTTPSTLAPAAATTAKATPAAAAPAAGTAGQQAYIDPKTGKFRPAEHDDVLSSAAPATGLRRLARTTAAEPQEFAAEGGAMGVAVPDELQPYTVATKTADGGVVIEHVTGGKAAAAKVRANSKKGATQPGKVEPNDR